MLEKLSYIFICDLKEISNATFTINCRIIWALVFILSCILSSLLIKKTYIKWQESPVIIGFQQTTNKIYDVPFPAITICPEKKFDYQFKYTREELEKLGLKEKVKLIDDDLRKILETYTQICPLARGWFRDFLGNLNFTESSETAFSYYEILMKHSKFKNAKSSSLWKNTYLSSLCSNYILSDEGVCLTFNVLRQSDVFRENVINFLEDNTIYTSQDIRHWTVDQGYKRNAKFTTYPLRLLKANPNSGYSVLYKGEKYIKELNCNGDEQDFKIHVHHPADWPFLLRSYSQSFYNMKTIISIKPVVTKTSADLSSYDPRL
jgi:amiloride-sensitive sodium channel